MKKQLMLIVYAGKLVAKSPAVVLINLLLTVPLAALAAYWFSPSVTFASVPKLVWALIVGLFLLVAWWVLDAGTAAYFYRVPRGESGVGVAYRQGTKRAVLFGLVAILWIGMWLLAEWSQGFWGLYADYLYSKLSAANRARAGFTGIQTTFHWILALAKWLVLPVLLLPWISMLCGAALNRESARNAARSYKQFGYWIGVLLAVAVAVWLPLALVDWHPGKGLEAEIVSLIVRFALAYILFVGGWLFALALAALASLSEVDAAAPTQSAIAGG